MPSRRRLLGYFEGAAGAEMEALPLQPHSATLMSFFVVLQCLTCFFRGIGISRFRSCSIPCDYVHLDFICFNFLKIGCFPFDVICYSQPDTCSTVHALPSKASGTH